MFTGLIEEVGSIHSIQKNSKSSRITIQTSHILEDARIGDSIAVNGVCLTVTEINKNLFVADVMSETVNVTNLSRLTQASPVNLERALRMGDRLGGHIVSGHVDTQGTVVGMHKDENAIRVDISCDAKFLKYVIHRGSICIDGISLTVAKLDSSSFQVSIIPHTSSETTLTSKKNGDYVNLEFDLFAKYTEKMLNYDSKEITVDFLKKHGF